MKKLLVVLAIAVSGIVMGQDDPLLTDLELYNALHADDIPGYYSFKSGDNDFHWSNGLLEHILTDITVRYIYGIKNPKINSLLVNRDFGIIKRENIPFTEWIETELNLSDYPADRYSITYRPVNLQYGRFSESLLIFDKQNNKLIRSISVAYSPMEYNENGDWVDVSEYKNIVNFQDQVYE